MTKKKTNNKPPAKFHLEFKNAAQSFAWNAFKQHDVLFLSGVAGTGKSHLAMAFAINEVLQRNKKRIILTRPIVEAGESLGYLPGSADEKVEPYMIPLFDCLKKMVGDGPQVDAISSAIEVAPLAYMRGRAEPLDSLIVTPSGYKRMGDIKIGDCVVGSTGKPIEVIGVYPQGKKPIYRVSFADKTSVKCSEDHLWSTMTLNEKRHNNGYTVKTTSEIMDSVKNKYNQKIHRIPLLSGPVLFEPQKISVDPYLLGVLLGDGHLRCGQVKLTTSDEELLNECKNRLPDGLVIKFRKNHDYSIIADEQQKGNGNVLLSLLKELDLVGTKSHNKFVPEIYKFNSQEIRLEVLKGLLDTDGWVGKFRSGTCRIQFYSTSFRLAEDVKFLVRSLGGFAYSRKREFNESNGHVYKDHIIRHVHPSYVVDIVMNQNPFKLSRKARKYVNNQKPVKLISSVEYIGDEECQCIQVDSDDHLYLTGDFVLTHNTFDNAICIFDEAQNATKMQLKLFLSRFGENSKIIVTGDPLQADIKDSGFNDVMARLENVPGIAMIRFKADSIVRHPLVSKILEKLDD